MLCICSSAHPRICVHLGCSSLDKVFLRSCQSLAVVASMVIALMVVPVQDSVGHCLAVPLQDWHWQWHRQCRHCYWLHSLHSGSALNSVRMHVHYPGGSYSVVDDSCLCGGCSKV